MGCSTGVELPDKLVLLLLLLLSCCCCCHGSGPLSALWDTLDEDVAVVRDVEVVVEMKDRLDDETVDMRTAEWIPGPAS